MVGRDARDLSVMNEKRRWTMDDRRWNNPDHRLSSIVHCLPSVRTLVRAAVSVALVAAMGTFCAADEYTTLPNLAPKPVPSLPGKPIFTEAKLLNGAGQPVNGIQLTVTADKLTLSETPGPIGQPLIVEPTTLHLIFRNVSNQPLVLDAYNLSFTRVVLVVVGPEKETVAVARRPISFKSRAALPIDYPQIEPGNPYVPMVALAPLQFPGDFNPFFTYSLYEPGEYKVQAVYTRAGAGGSELAAWQGRVVSNTLTFRITGPMPTPPPESATPGTTPGATPDSPQQPTPKPPPPPPNSPS